MNPLQQAVLDKNNPQKQKDLKKESGEKGAPKPKARIKEYGFLVFLLLISGNLALFYVTPLLMFMIENLISVYRPTFEFPMSETEAFYAHGTAFKTFFPFVWLVTFRLVTKLSNFMRDS